MTCIHLQKLYQLCREEDLRLSGTDLIRIVCQQCGVQEVCPSMLQDEYDTKEQSAQSKAAATDAGHADDPHGMA